MSRLLPVQRSDLIKILRANGLTEVRSASKHCQIMTHPGDHTRWTTIPNDREIFVPRLKRILEQVKKPRDEYQRLLRSL
jgi:predicted RNA binding protein YcfA (HicA-like mRNA interferase family)